MDVKNLFEIFVSAKNISSGDNKFSVLSIDGMKHKIGKSSEGYPKVFVSTKTTNSPTPNLNGELFSVEYNVMCSLVDDNDENTDEIYSIITLRSLNEELCKIFFEVFGMALVTLPKVPADTDLAIKIEGLLSIFAAIKRKPIKKIQGLWAELLVIEQSQDPGKVASAWHNSPGAKYDFTMGTDKVEVKSTSSENRIHKFALDQLNPTPSANLLIASVIVRESAHDSNGLSVNDLYSRISQRVADIDTRMHIYSTIANTLGEDFENASNVCFDYASACDSLEFYEYQDIPKITRDAIPPFVTAVKFDSELSHLQSVKDKGIIFDKDSLLGAL